MNEKDRSELFEARISELSRRAGRGQIAAGDFLTPREIHEAEIIIKRLGAGVFGGGGYAFFGGYDGAERARLFCLPDYMLYGETDPYSAAVSAAEDFISVLRVTGSGYRELSHRDFMGSILSLGIKRGVLGDIITDGDAHGAYVFCDGKIAPFIAENLTKIASDTVRAEITALPHDFRVERKREPLSDTVASPRADAVVSALVRVSRERAKEIIAAGSVEVNYETLVKPDAEIAEGDIVSVRGSGKFLIVGIDELTRRGRIRLFAEKYI